METMKVLVINVPAFLTAFMSIDLKAIEILKITRCWDDCAHVTVRCSKEELFWLGYLYNASRRVSYT